MLIRRAFSMSSAVIVSSCGVGMPAAGANSCTAVGARRSRVGDEPRSPAASRIGASRSARAIGLFGIQIEVEMI